MPSRSFPQISNLGTTITFETLISSKSLYLCLKPRVAKKPLTKLGLLTQSILVRINAGVLSLQTIYETKFDLEFLIFNFSSSRASVAKRPRL